MGAESLESLDIRAVESLLGVWGFINPWTLCCCWCVRGGNRRNHLLLLRLYNIKPLPQAELQVTFPYVALLIFGGI